MLTTPELAQRWRDQPDGIDHPIRHFSFPRFGRTFDDTPTQLGVINLSRDSTYRESLALDLDMALYRARRMTIEGASMIDVGAESTGDTADIVDAESQLGILMPVIRALAAENILVSVETYEPAVAIAALEAGAGVINLTGRVDEPEMYEAIARHEAGLIMCYTPGTTARSKDNLPDSEVLIDEQLAFFEQRVEMVTAAGIERLWIDPGFGFALNLRDGPERVRFQTESLLSAYRFRVFGWPVCVTMPSSVWHFRDEVRCAETANAVLALMGHATLLRSHEVARVQPVLELLRITR